MRNSISRILLAVCLCGGLFTISAQAQNFVVAPASDWQYFKALQEPSLTPSAWRQIGFDDSGFGWETGPAPFFYENGSGFSGNTVLSDMFGNYTGIYMRKTFNVSNPAIFESLTLDVESDDGCIVWINGVEVARINCPAGDIAFDGTSNGAAGEPNQFNEVLSDLSMLVAGDNVLAIHALNSSIGSSSDFLIEASLESEIDNIAPTLISELPPATATVQMLNQIEVFFSEPVVGIDASDLLINGSPATDVSFGSSSSAAFMFTEPPTGHVDVAFAEGHGITDQSPLANPFAGASWFYTLDPNAEPPGVIINEFMASNDDTLNDEDGDSSDWIELKNAGFISANMDGYYLTDNPNNLTKWRIPGVIILPDEYLIIFASNKDRTNVLAPLHANFTLNAGEGEYLALVDPDGNVISEFAPTFPPQSTDISYGRDRANPEIVGFFPEPTPGAQNSDGGTGFGPEVIFSVESRAFLSGSSFNVELSTESPTAVIHYTTDDTLPTQASPVYSTPIQVNTTGQIRARAYEPDPSILPGPPQSHYYISVESAVYNRNVDLPQIIMHTFGRGTANQNSELLIIMMVFEKEDGFSNLGNPPDLATRGRIKIRGSSTAGYPKQSWAMESWDEFNEDTDVELLGMPSERDWVFYAPNNFEPSLIHNPLAQELQNQMGVYGPRTRFAVVHYKDDGGGNPGTVIGTDYNGIYAVMEKIKRDRNRVDIENLQPEHVNEPEVTGGYLLKVDRPDPGDSGFSAAGQVIRYVDPKEPEIETPQRDPQEQYIRQYFTDFGAALNGPNYTDPDVGFKSFLDVDAAINHSIHNTLTFNVDALRLSGYFYKTRDRTDQYGRFIPGKITYGPSWDFDRTQGSTDGRDNNPRVWSKNLPGDQGTDFWKYTWWNRMFTDPDFFQAWIDRYEDLREPGQPFHLETLFATIDGLVDQVRNEQPREQARWNVTPRGGSYEAEIQLWKKDWFSNRLDFADSQFLAKPTFSQKGGDVAEGTQLTIGAPEGGTIYYTMDGSDPRASGGAIGANAITYGGPITINDNVRIFARAFDINHENATGNVGDSKNPPISSHWSGRTVASYVVRIPSLIISEIMYNAAPPPAGNTNDANGFEYIELKNIGSTTLSLARFQLTGGILFDFTGGAVTTLAPGETVLVVKNQALFESRYGSGLNIAGEYLGNLANDGERIVLTGSALETVHDFSYDDAWFPSTDGFGFALVVADENQPREAWNTRAGWRVGSVLGGTPDMDEPPAPNIPVVYVNEALTHTDLPDVDAIELYNPNDTQVDIGGWLLSDDFRTPKFEIPAGTTIEPHDYIVFTEAVFNAVGDTNGFNLRSSGDEVYLYSGDGAGNLTGYIHGFDFGASLNGISFGRYINSQGDEHFVSQSVNTLGFTNAPPRVGPIVISEIMYHPPANFVGGEVIENSQNEFVELANITGSAVPMFDPNATTNTWRLRDAVDYAFPQGVMLEAGEKVIVVSFDPVADPTSASAFRATYGLSPAVRLFGPFDGRLSNGGEDVELVQPDVVRFYTTNIVITGVIIDKVDYEDLPPWPLAADGVGPSLQRIDESAYGNDPINWSAATPGPGNAYVPGPAPVIVTQPTDQIGVQTREATFSVQVSGSGPFRFQWLHNGDVIPFGTNQVLELTGLRLSDAGLYQVVVLNNANSVASDPANLSVEIPATITLQPKSTTVNEGGSVIFSVGAVSTSAITYQWRKDGEDISGATGQTYTINNVEALTHRGVYDVAVTDAVGTIFTEPAILTVLVPPIVIHPTGRLDLRVVQGQDLIVSVEFDEKTTLPLGIRWRRGFTGTDVHVVNKRSSYFLMQNVQPPRLQPFDNWVTVSITNPASAIFLTLTNDLTVLTDADGDFMADEFEQAYGLLMNDPSDKDLDPDDDGMTNYEESVAGTDPTDGNSYLKVDEIEAGGGVNITFEAKASRTYSIEFKDDINSAVWQKLTDVPSDIADRVVVVEDGDGSSSRIYRLAAPQLDYGDRFPQSF